MCSQFLLEMLVHHINHSVAEAPQEEERTDENEGDEQAFAFLGGEEAGFCHGLIGGL